MSIQNVELLEFRQNHRPFCAQARDQGDVIELDYPDSSLGMYVVCSHRGVNEVLRNACGNYVHFADYFSALENKSDVDEAIGEIFSKNLANNDAIHLELRKDIRSHFNGAGLDQHSDFMRSCIADLIDNLKKKAKENNGVVDLVKDFSEPLSFLVTAHIIGLDFENEEDKVFRSQQASEAIQIINLIASDEDKRKALTEHQSLCEFVLPQLQKYAAKDKTGLRQDCLLYDFGSKLGEGDTDKLRSYVELVNGLFQAGLGAVGNFLALCLHLILEGDENNTSGDLKAYYCSNERTDEEKREAIAEFIRLEQGKLNGLIPRYVKGDTELQGNPIKGNSLVYMNFAAANFDEKAFSEPLLFKAGRTLTPKNLTKEEINERRQQRIEKNVSFSYGEHMCPGRRMSLSLIRHAIDGLLEAFPNIESIEIDAFSEVMGKPARVFSYDVDLKL